MILPVHIRVVKQGARISLNLDKIVQIDHTPACMNKHILIHYDELGLKGKNRPFFERALEKNINRSIKRVIGKGVPIRKEFGRFRIELTAEMQEHAEAIEKVLKHVFGIAWFAFVTSVPHEVEAITKEAINQFKENKDATSFRISARRSYKYFPMTSMELCAHVGAAINQAYGTAVDLEQPETTVFLEVTQEAAHVFAKKIEGARGLPVGSSGKAIIMLSGGIDSPVAAFYAMKRGLEPIYVHFHSAPYTSDASQEKVKELKATLDKFFPGYLQIIPFADIQKSIVFEAPEHLRVILYRVFMLKIAEALATQHGAQAIVTGESLGQVASQTIQNIAVTDQSTPLPILRPLIGFDKQEIIEKAKQIGTYNISVQPHDDCCTIFLPKRPATKTQYHEIAPWLEHTGLTQQMQRIIPKN